MNEKTTLQKSIERTTTDVINQLHQLKGLDRHHLLMEHYEALITTWDCLLYTSPSPRDRTRSRMPSSA